MSAKKGSKKAATALAKANADDGVPERITAEAPQTATPAALQIDQQVATVEAVAATPRVKKGKSSIQFPVAYVWALCFNMISAAKTAGTETPARKTMVDAAINDGVAFYTARTQVQAFLKAPKDVNGVPLKRPRGFNVGEAKPAATAE